MLYYIIFKVQEKMIEVGKSTTGIKRAVGIWAKKTGDFTFNCRNKTLVLKIYKRNSKLV